MPKVVRVTETGGPEVMTYTERDVPEPGQGELLVDVDAAGVNFIDTYHRSGAYPLELPFVPGLEGAGTVSALGSGVDRFRVGDRVAWGHTLGSYAEQVRVPAEQAVPVPDGIDSATAAAAMLQGMTAHYLVASVHPVAAGETVLVHAGAGGVGLLLIQLVKARKATVITTVSTTEKERLARSAGADEVIGYQDFSSRVRSLTGGRGVDVVYDGVGRATFDESLASVCPRGMLALFGAASGPVEPFDPQRLNSAGSVFLTRPKLADYVRTREELEWRAGEIFDALAGGRLTIRTGGSYALSDAARAHADLEARRTTGKLLLLP
ncbi:quinone oxidoreductase [Haloechinothrix sp. LS1_15]|uniref:quinone oxidoreductase family protein n=1 Tax=Haloechinothrix sp. LS1_15 TaxID=2652248 RepID=UPI0029487114|nr:quinone oxidoreductase [Haloechinothrix sp. LS1_15]MDV6013223.1 quinone oxidoreductase [Haloechinothrix sp. LS1_15]